MAGFELAPLNLSLIGGIKKFFVFPALAATLSREAGTSAAVDVVKEKGVVGIGSGPRPVSGPKVRNEIQEIKNKNIT